MQKGKIKILKQTGDKFLIKDGNGVIRKVTRDKKGIERGDYLQPIGKERDKFVKKYGWLPGESKKDVEKFLRRHK